MKKYFQFIVLIPLFISCVKDKPQDIIQPKVQLTSAKKVYVINEGNFGSGNATVSLFDTGNNTVIENFYQTQNSSLPIVGDVAQSLSNINSKFYLVVNNSGKIIVCDAQFKKVTQITNLSSPRYILPITNQKAYVSDYNANAISVLDLNSNTKVASIPCSGWTEQMVLIYNKAFVTNMKRNYTYVINTINDTKSDSIQVGINAGSSVVDKNDKVWILSSGDNANSVLGKLSRIDPITNLVEATYQFPANNSPNSLCLNKTKDTLYFLNGGVFKMAINSQALPATAFIPNGTKNFYGLGINPNDFSIYVADALDYVQRSTIYIFDANGNQKSYFKAGINANGFYFE
jgi:sugar lactone lactonase YvrE